jgi:hypothetical protein
MLKKAGYTDITTYLEDFTSGDDGAVSLYANHIIAADKLLNVFYEGILGKK